MHIAITLFVAIHLLCWAAAFGMWTAAIKSRQPNKGMAHAAAAAPLFGLIAAVLAIVSGGSIDHMTIGIKFVIAVIVAVFSFIAVKKQEGTNALVWFGIPAGIIANVLIALF